MNVVKSVGKKNSFPASLYIGMFLALIEFSKKYALFYARGNNGSVEYGANFVISCIRRLFGLLRIGMEWENIDALKLLMLCVL